MSGRLSPPSSVLGAVSALAWTAVLASIWGPYGATALLGTAAGWLVGGWASHWLIERWRARRVVRIETPDGLFESTGMTRQELQAVADRFAAARKRGAR